MRSDRDVERDRAVERTVMREPVRSGSADSTERIRTAARWLSADVTYEIQGDYWDIIEAALTSLPETNRLRAPALASFDHLKARVLARGGVS